MKSASLRGSFIKRTVESNSKNYITNVQGDILGITDKNANVVAKYTYDAWGKHTAITNGSGTDVSSNASHIANINPLRYRGYYFDTESSFYYLESRYYDPVTGRFINADSIGNTSTVLGMNLFAYCLNNPVMLIDPDGNIPFSAIVMPSSTPSTTTSPPRRTPTTNTSTDTIVPENNCTAPKPSPTPQVGPVGPTSQITSPSGKNLRIDVGSRAGIYAPQVIKTNAEIVAIFKEKIRKTQAYISSLKITAGSSAVGAVIPGPLVALFGTGAAATALTATLIEEIHLPYLKNTLQYYEDLIKRGYTYYDR